jgi:hypothetical protein
MSVSTTGKDARDTISSPETFGSMTTIVESRPYIDEKRLICRIDWRILPFLCTVYFMSFIDKIVLNYANVMGMRADIDMSAKTFTWLGTGFHVGYAIAEFGQGEWSHCSSYRAERADEG